MVSQWLISFLALAYASKTKPFLCSQQDYFYSRTALKSAALVPFHHFNRGEKQSIVLSLEAGAECITSSIPGFLN